METANLKKVLAGFVLIALVSGVLIVNTAMGVTPTVNPNDPGYVSPTFSIVNILKDLIIGGSIGTATGTPVEIKGVKVTGNLLLYGHVQNPDVIELGRGKVSLPVEIKDPDGLDLWGPVQNSSVAELPGKPGFPVQISDGEGVDITGPIANKISDALDKLPVLIGDSLQINKYVDVRDTLVNLTPDGQKPCLAYPGCVQPVKIPVKVDDDFLVTGKSDFQGDVSNSTVTHDNVGNEINNPVRVSDKLEVSGNTDLLGDVHVGGALSAVNLGFLMTDQTASPVVKDPNWWNQQATCPAGSVLISCSFSSNVQWNFTMYGTGVCISYSVPNSPPDTPTAHCLTGGGL